MGRAMMGLTSSALGLVLLWPGAAAAELGWWPFGNTGERKLAEARSAREVADFSTADALLTEVEQSGEEFRARACHERGLVARDQGNLEAAVALLGQAADMDPMSSARVDRAGVLVQLGRWPEAVVVLQKAFEERGPDLKAVEVASDSRFATLATFAPFVTLLEDQKMEQAGPLSRLLLKIERIEASLRVAYGVLEGAQKTAKIVADLAAILGAPVIALIFLALLLSFGVQQLGVLAPPWTLVTGLVLASGAWHVAARVVSADTSGGWGTIGLGWAVVASPWVLAQMARWLWRSRARARSVSRDPFSADNLRHTLAILEEFNRLGWRFLEANEPNKQQTGRDLRQAGEALRQRLGCGTDE